jgi:hypothetical protein
MIEGLRRLLRRRPEPGGDDPEAVPMPDDIRRQVDDLLARQRPPWAEEEST